MGYAETLRVGAVELAYSRVGAGDPLILIHGSWDDMRCWDALSELLVDDFRVLRYDRRGHGESSAPPGQGCIGEDVDDAAGLMGALGDRPAHIVGHSYGASIALLLALRYPQLCRSVIVHEPPVFALLKAAGRSDLLVRIQQRMADVVALLTGGGGISDASEATRIFVEDIGFGPGTWDRVLDQQQRATFIRHADTWLDQSRDPQRLAITADELRRIATPTLLTYGNRGLPWYPLVTEQLHAAIPDARRRVIDGAAHAPHLTNTAEFAGAITEFTRSVG